MYKLKMKNLGTHMHMPNRHDMALKFGHIVHDDRFWVVMALVIFMGILLAAAIWASLQGESSGQLKDIAPFPYRF